MSRPKPRIFISHCCSGYPPDLFALNQLVQALRPIAEVWVDLDFARAQDSGWRETVRGWIRKCDIAVSLFGKRAGRCLDTTELSPSDYIHEEAVDIATRRAHDALYDVGQGFVEVLRWAARLHCQTTASLPQARHYRQLMRVIDPTADVTLLDILIDSRDSAIDSSSITRRLMSIDTADARALLFVHLLKTLGPGRALDWISKQGMDDLRRLTANGWRNVLALLIDQERWDEALALAAIPFTLATGPTKAPSPGAPHPACGHPLP